MNIEVYFSTYQLGGVPRTIRAVDTIEMYKILSERYDSGPVFISRAWAKQGLVTGEDIVKDMVMNSSRRMHKLFVTSNYQ